MPENEYGYYNYGEPTDQLNDAYLNFTNWVNNNTGLDVNKHYLGTEPLNVIDYGTFSVEKEWWQMGLYRSVELNGENNEYSKNRNKKLHAIGVEFYLYQEFLLQYKGKPTIEDLNNIDLDYKPIIPNIWGNMFKGIDLLAPPTQEQNEKFKAMKKAQKDKKDAKKAKAKQKKKDKEAQFFKDLQEEGLDLEGFEGL